MKQILLLSVLAVLSACRADRVSVVAIEPAKPAPQVSSPGEHRVASRAITPITSLTASRPAELGGTTTGSLKASEWIDVIGWTGTGTATLNLVYYDVTAARWIRYGSDCPMTTSSSACRYTAKVGAFYWHVFKATGTITDVYIESVVRTSAAIGSLEPAAAGGLSNVSVTSPLSGDGTAGSPLALGTVGVANGGTGQTSITAGDLLVGSAGNNLSKLAIGASGTSLTSNGTTAAWTALLPAAGTAGRLLYDNGTSWAALAAGTSGQVVQSGGAGAPSWVWRTSHVWAFTSTPTLNWYFGAVSANGTAHNVRGFYIKGDGKINFAKLYAINATANGSITVQVYTSTDGYTFSAVAGQTRTITLTSGTVSATSTGSLADITVTDGMIILLRMTGYSGTAASLNALITATEGAQIA